MSAQGRLASGSVASRAFPARHPCLGCGACCAAYRVSFYQGELAGLGGTVPDALVEPVSPFLVAMAGTARGASVRCVALEGELGRDVRCRIYAARPSPCHDVRPSWEAGAPDERCDRARARHGLTPLRPEDWNEDGGAASPGATPP